MENDLLFRFIKYKNNPSKQQILVIILDVVLNQTEDLSKDNADGSNKLTPNYSVPKLSKIMI